MTAFSDSDWLPMDTFEALPEDALQQLENSMPHRQFAQGEHLIHQGDIGEEMYVITSGHAVIMTEDDSGQRHVIARTGPGDVLGEMALLAREPRTADAIAQDEVVTRVLSAKTFHSLKDTYPEFSRFLTRLVATRVGGRDRDVLVDRNMHGYRITRRLGRGGMAVVYEAVGDDGQLVALKMMSHRLVCDQRSRDFFHREADIIETFDHPNIVKMLGRFEMFYTYFIVVEFIDGLSLFELIRYNGPLPADDVQAIFGQLAKAIDYAHQSGITHRDIKPGNVMVSRNGTVKLMDFGLAKPTADNSDADRVLVGTPGYMAPELFNQGEPGPKSDLFAMGCLAVELLTGQKLFNQSQPHEFVAAVAKWSGWDPKSLDITIPEELANAITSWLDPSPQNRMANLESISQWAATVQLPDDVDILDSFDEFDPTWTEDDALDSTETF